MTLTRWYKAARALMFTLHNINAMSLEFNLATSYTLLLSYYVSILTI